MSEKESKPVVFVTGASSGIGQATAVLAAERGADVVIHYCGNRVGIEETQSAIEEAGSQCLTLQLDYHSATPADFSELCQQAWNWRGRVDTLVNNAGGDVLTNERKQWPLFEKLNFLWKVDVASTMEMSRSMGQLMKKASLTPLPSIINIGWDQAMTGQGGESGELFSATKGAIICFSRSLAKSLSPNVRVNTVAPGWVQTSWGNETSEYWDQRAKSESLLNRWGTPKDIAGVILQIAAADAQFINGQVIDVNGGLAFGK